MAVTMEDVRAAIDPDEPDYDRAAEELGTEALPHLEVIVQGDDVGLASKAASLAGRIGDEESAAVLEKAARREDPRIRVAAAAAAGELPAAAASRVLRALVADRDMGVQKHALRSVPEQPSRELREQLESLDREVAEPLRPLVRETMRRLR